MVNDMNFSAGNFSDFCGLIPHDYLLAKLILISILATLIGLFGVIGNTITIILLTRPQMRSPNNLFLTFLAIFDTALLISAFMVYGMEYIIQYKHSLQLNFIWLRYLRVTYIISHISQTGSVYITVAVTLERYLAVMKPKYGEVLCNKLGAYLTIGFVACFALCFNIPKFYEFSVQRNPYCAPDTFQAYVPMPTPFAEKPIYAVGYSLWAANVVMLFSPFVILLLFNGILTVHIRRTSRRTLENVISSAARIVGIGNDTCIRGRIERRSREKRHEIKVKSREATIVLVVMVTVFLVCNLWPFVLSFTEQIVGEKQLAMNHPTFYAFSREAINFLSIINSSINFIVYFFFSKEFRKQLVSICCCGTVTMCTNVKDRFALWRNLRPSFYSSVAVAVYMESSENNEKDEELKDMELILV